MMKTTALFFLGLAFIGDASAGISGRTDKREIIGWIGDQPDYVSELQSVRYIWNTSPYSSIVQVRSGTTRGTGEFISPRHILTNAHVTQGCGTNGKNDCTIYTSNNQILSAREFLFGANLTDASGKFNDDKWYRNRGKDWAILEVVGDYCHKEYRNQRPASIRMNNLWRAGFGGLRVLSEEDIEAIRKAYKTYLRSGNKTNTRGTSFGDVGVRSDAKFEIFLKEFTNLTGKDFIADYNQDSNTLKLIQDCNFTGSSKNSGSMNIVRHSCNAWAGDSGSGIKDMSTNDLVGLDYAGVTYVTLGNNEDASLDEAILAYTIYSDDVQDAIKKSTISCATNKPLKDLKPVEPKPIEQQPDWPNVPTKEKPVTPVPEPIEPVVQEPVKPVEPVKPIQKTEPIKEPTERELWGQCLAEDLKKKPHATAGHYIPYGRNDLNCKGEKPCACAATSCEKGWYLAATAKGASNGYCRSGKCPKGKHPNIIDGKKLTGCVRD